ncbi:553_t:CDS:2 [Paraglomus occultum]|uniref:553_t:CDS:1 n=1 Tax=Paraglomus occultum TaxID=144539 RepID=A0A9N9AX74_9GLOM|nr:553_t:CDS:2 [Paraglomus occultum]
MALSFMDRFSSDIHTLLDHSKLNNVLITVGSKKNTKEFQAHSLILRARSLYFKAALSRKWVKSRNGIILLNESNMDPDIFEILLRYFYSGKLDITHIPPQTILSLLEAADTLRVDELIIPIQTFVLSTYSPWLRRHLALVHRIAFKHPPFKLLQDFFNQIIKSQPELVFESEDFVDVEETLLITLLAQDELRMHECDVWNYTIRWGLANTKGIKGNVDCWSQSDIDSLKSTLKHCLHLIRYFNISADNFKTLVKPYRHIVPSEIYDKVTLSPALPDNEVVYSGLCPRRGPIESTLINTRQAAVIASWIDQGLTTTEYGWTPYAAENNPFEFHLLIRGSRDGFTSRKFHDYCSMQGATVTVIKVRDTEEIIGGYTPHDWYAPRQALVKWKRARRSFIFSFGSSIEDKPVVSRVKHYGCATANSSVRGPWFGEADLGLKGHFKEEKLCVCKRVSYDKDIRQSAENFSVEEYEVFKIVKKTSNEKWNAKRDEKPANDCIAENIELDVKEVNIISDAVSVGSNTSETVDYVDDNDGNGVGIKSEEVEKESERVVQEGNKSRCISIKRTVKK